MIGGLIGPIANLAGTFLQGRLERAKANTEMKVAEAKARATVMEKQATGEIDWDLEAIRGARNSWKDEWFAVILSLPLICAFIPSMVPYVQEGFNVLATMPDYYKVFLGGAISASFGIKTLSTWGKK